MQGVPDKEMGAFLTFANKKRKRKLLGAKLLGHGDSVMIRKTVAMATHCQTVELLPGRGWGKPFVCYTWQGFPLAQRPPYTAGGTLANREDIHLICSCYTYPERQPDLNKK